VASFDEPKCWHRENACPVPAAAAACSRQHDEFAFEHGPEPVGQLHHGRRRPRRKPRAPPAPRGLVAPSPRASAQRPDPPRLDRDHQRDHAWMAHQSLLHLLAIARTAACPPASTISNHPPAGCPLICDLKPAAAFVTWIPQRRGIPHGDELLLDAAHDATPDDRSQNPGRKLLALCPGPPAQEVISPCHDP